MRKEWLVPGILISLVSAMLSIGGGWALKDWRLGSNEAAIGELKQLILDSNRTTGQRIDKLDDRLNQMAKDGTETVRLQERVNTLERAIAQFAADAREYEGRNAARYDNLGTRLARLER